MATARISLAIACLLAAPLARADLSFATASNLAAAITDHGYNGTLASMTCVDIPVTGTAGARSLGISVTASIDHTWIGDLVIKVVNPQNTVVTLVSRPGVTETADDGTSNAGAGDSSNLSSMFPITFVDGAATSAEAMGSSLADNQIVCKDDGACSFDPNAGSAAAGKLGKFLIDPVLGTWKFCAGDAGLGDTGAIQRVQLTFKGMDPGNLVITPQTLDFGAVVQGTTSAVRLVTLANSGTQQLTVNSLTLAQPPFQRTIDGSCGNSLPRVLAGGSSCTLSYAFSPTVDDVVSQGFTVGRDSSGDTTFTLQGSGDALFVDGFEP